MIRRMLHQVHLNSLSRNLVGAHHGCHPSQVTHIVWEHMKVSPDNNSPNGFRSICMNRDLSIKNCVPCNAKDLRPMTKEAANALILKVPWWTLMDEGGMLKLSRSWKVKSFMKGLDLFQKVADVAEAEGHHPDLHLVGWNNVKIDIWTHAVGGLTENDFILATKIDGLELEHLLRRKPTN